MDNKKKMVTTVVGVCIGIILSFFLSFTGIMLSHHFTIVGFLVSFLCSSIICIILGFIIPIKAIGDAAVAKAGIEPNKPGAICLQALISDLIYTPLMTFLMVLFSTKRASRFSPEDIPFLPMFVKSIIPLFILGFVLLVILIPLVPKVVLKIMVENKEENEENQ